MVDYSRIKYGLALLKVSNFNVSVCTAYISTEFSLDFFGSPGLPVYFIEPLHPDKLFWRGQFYGERDDFRRFSFFSRAALELLLQAGKKPDIIHCHDWQTAFVVWTFKLIFFSFTISITMYSDPSLRSWFFSRLHFIGTYMPQRD